MIRSEDTASRGTCKRDSHRFHEDRPVSGQKAGTREFLQPEPLLAVIPAFLAIQLSLELFIGAEMNYSQCKF